MGASTQQRAWSAEGVLRALEALHADELTAESEVTRQRARVRAAKKALATARRGLTSAEQQLRQRRIAVVRAFDGATRSGLTAQTAYFAMCRAEREVACQPCVRALKKVVPMRVRRFRVASGIAAPVSSKRR